MSIKATILCCRTSELGNWQSQRLGSEESKGNSRLCDVHRVGNDVEVTR